MTRTVSAAPAAMLIILSLFLAAASAPAQEADDKTEDERRRLEAIKALPYVTWTENEVDEKEHGVTVYDSLRAYNGYTLYVGKQHATLVDMRGNEVHSWRHPELRRFEHVKLTPEGIAYALFPREGVYKLDWDTNILWLGEGPVHHDFDMLPDGDLLAVAYDRVWLKDFEPQSIISDKIIRLGKDGGFTDVWRLHEHRDELAKWCPEEALNTVSRDVPDDDWSHMNTIEIIREPGISPLSPDLGTNRGTATDVAASGERHPAFQPGNALICVRNLDFIGVVDLETGEILWGWGPGEVDHPHQPTLLENGNILIFDNGFFRGWSRVIEYDPVSDGIVWEYRGDDKFEFYSRGRGSAQKLPNGNVLITESAEGRVFEVTRDGDIVWDFYNPSRQTKRRATFYRSFRIDRDLVDGWLEAASD